MEWLSNLISYGLAAAGVVFFTVNSYQSSELGVSSSQLNKNNSELLCLDKYLCKINLTFIEIALLSIFRKKVCYRGVALPLKIV